MAIEFKQDKFIDEDKLDKKEAEHFIDFLEEEKQRHIIAMKVADANSYASREIPVLMIAYRAQMERHIDDIKMIQVCIDKLRRKYNLMCQYKQFCGYCGCWINKSTRKG